MFFDAFLMDFFSFLFFQLSEIVKIGMCRWKYYFNEDILHMFAKEQIGFWWRERSMSSVTFTLFLASLIRPQIVDCDRIESEKNQEKREREIKRNNPSEPFGAVRSTILSFHKIAKWKDVKKNIMHPHDLEQTGRLNFYYFHYRSKDVPERNRCFPKVKDLNELFRKLNKKYNEQKILLYLSKYK